MKKLLLVPICLAVLTGVGQQSITLSFAARDGLNNPVALDSVFVQNTTTGCDTMIYGPDPSLTLLMFVGIHDNIFNPAEDFIMLTAMPNPFSGSTNVQINVKEKGSFTLFLSDVAGKKLYQYQKTLDVGLHQFNISTSCNSLLFLNVLNGRTTKAVKLINLGNSFARNCISYAGKNGEDPDQHLKSLELSGFAYCFGDQLSYTASSYRYYNDTIFDSPSQDTTYTFIMTHLPWECGDPVYYEGHTYNTVQIGTQCWMKENLNLGTMINPPQNQANNDTIEKYCYNNIAWNCAIYGGLYQWDELMQYTTISGARGICPQGWHVSTDLEWTILTNYLGGTEVAGGKLKEAGYAHWLPPNAGATNESGFTGLPGGWWAPMTFTGLGTHAHFWSSTQTSSTQACNRVLFYSFPSIQANPNIDKVQAESVRCIKSILK